MYLVHLGTVVPLEITCMEITDTFIGGIGSCSTSGGLGIITFTCRTDDESEFKTCKSLAQILNVLHVY